MTDWTGSNNRRLSWLIGIGLLLFIAAFSVLSTIGKQLLLMHLPSVQGFTLGGFAPVHLEEAVPVWHAFHNQLIENVGREVYVSPRALLSKSLLIDSFVLVPAYLVSGLAFFIRSRTKNHDHPRLQEVIRWAVGLLIAAAALDLFENLITSLLVGRYWSTPSADPNILDGALGPVTWAKWIAVLLVFFCLVPLALRAIRDRSSASKATMTLLRPFIGVALVAIALLNLPIQLSDLFLALDGRHSAILAGATLLMGASVWASARLSIASHERRKEEDRPLTWIAVVGLLMLPSALLVWNLSAGGNWKVVLIPIAIVVVLILLGFSLRGIPGAQDQRLERDLPRLAITGPQLLAAATIAAVSIAALRALVLQWVQKGDTSVLLILGVGLLLASIVITFVIYEVETLVAWERQPEGKSIRPKDIQGLVTEALTEGARKKRLLVYGGVAAFCAIVALVLTSVLILDPQRAPAVGAVAVVLIFLSILALITGSFSLFAGWWTDRFGLPFAFRPFHLKTVPIFTLLLIWGVIASSIDDGTHWNARVWPDRERLWTDTDPHEGLTLKEAFKKWKANHVRLTTNRDGTSVPLIIVAASGGGIRAAYWTALSLDCLLLGKQSSEFEGEKNSCSQGSATAVGTQYMFLASGISGGSLGLVEWDANQARAWNSSWVEDQLGGDFVSPSMAQGLFVEFARSFLQFPAPGRAETLEDAWIKAWGEDDENNPMGEGFLASQEKRIESGGPFLLLNGSSVFDGCALNVSLLELGSSIDQSLVNAPLAFSGGDCTSVERYTGGEDRDVVAEDLAPGGDEAGPLPATADLIDYLDCDGGTDVSRATAALLSARFPYVSSAGRLAACGGADSAKFIVDGGYVDTSGAESAMAVWSALEPMVEKYNARHSAACITPYFIQLDNGYLPTLAPRSKRKPPNQVIAPLQALMQTTGLESRAARARAMAAEQFTRAYPPARWGKDRAVRGRYVLIAPRAHPGVEAPLGWTLSEQSQQDLETQLYRGNSQPISRVRSWIEDSVKCSTQQTKESVP